MGKSIWTAHYGTRTTTMTPQAENSKSSPNSCLESEVVVVSMHARSLSLSLCLSLGSSCNGVDRPRSRCIFRDLRPAGPVSAGHLRGFSGPDKPDQTSRTGRTTADGIRTHTSLTHYSGGLPLSPPSPSRRHQRTPLRPSRRRARAPHATDARAPR